MRKMFLAVFTATLFIVACDGDPTTDLCAGITCGHGTCSPDTGNCVCDSGYSGDTCDMTFDTSNCLTMKVFGPTDSGQLEVAGVTGSAYYCNGSYLEVSEGTVDKNSLFCIMPAFGTNLPVPIPVGEHLVPGLVIFAIDPEQPILPNGDLNKVTLLKEVKIFFNEDRGRVVRFEDNVFTNVTTELVETGTIAMTLHFSEFYLLDQKPVISATAQHQGNRVVVIDFTGTLDEDSPLPYLLQFSASGGGTPLVLEPVDSRGLKFSTTLPNGQSTITAIVTDPYGNEDSKEVSVTDLCLGVTCDPWEWCREIDGVCVGDDPCDPNPCIHGTCDNSTGSAICTCDGGWLGNLCDQQDLCYQVACSGHGTCKPADGSCQCNTGYSGATCNACASGYLGYPNCADDPCDPDPCNGHGSCSGGLCSCDTGYTGINCDACDTGYGPAFPTCNPVPTISGLSIDCSSTGGWCGAGGFNYPVTFTATNAYSCSATSEVLPPGIGTPGSVSACVTTGNSGSLTFTTGDMGGDFIRITVTVYGPGGQDSAYVDFKQW